MSSDSHVSRTELRGRMARIPEVLSDELVERMVHDRVHGWVNPFRAEDADAIRREDREGDRASIWRPAYVRDACLVFDPRDGLVRDASGVLESGGFDERPYPRTVVGASFEALVERGWRECPDELAAFRDLCDRDLRVGLDLGELDRAVDVHRATRMGLHRLLAVCPDRQLRLQRRSLPADPRKTGHGRRPDRRFAGLLRRPERFAVCAAGPSVCLVRRPPGL